MTIRFLPPFLILLLSGAYLRLREDSLPARWPVHWGTDGRPNGWSERNFIGIYGSLLLGAAIVALIIGIRFIIARQGSAAAAPDKRDSLNVALTALDRSAWLIAIIFSYVSFLPLHVPYPFAVILGLVFLHVILTTFSVLRVRRNPLP
jgi:uncharacterized membrane protein